MKAARAAGRRTSGRSRAGTSRCSSRSRRCGRARPSQIAVRELGGDVIEPPADVVARRPRDDRRRRAQPRALGLRRRRPHLRAGAAAAFAAAAPRLRVVNALTNEEHPCQALADCLTLIERWGPARPDDRVRRRRQQRRDVARPGRGDARRARRVASPPGFELPADGRARRRARRAFGGGVARHQRSDRGRRRRRRGLHRRLDVDGPGERSRRAPRAIFAPYQVNAALMSHAPAGRALHALPAGASRRRSHRRGHRFACVGGVRSGGEPPAHAEGAARDAGG